MEAEIIHDKEICGGKACLKGTRIRVIDIVERYLSLKENAGEIAEAFGIPIQYVFEALSYYYSHSLEIKKEMEGDKALARKLKEELKSVVYAT